MWLVATWLESRERLLDSREACKQTILHSCKGLCLLLMDVSSQEALNSRSLFEIVQSQLPVKDDLCGELDGNIYRSLLV